MIIRIDMNNNIEICSCCLGSGELKAMQSVLVIGGSIRGRDTKIKCKRCNGTGIVYK